MSAKFTASFALLCLSLSLLGCGAKKPGVLRQPVLKVAIQPAYSVHIMTKRYKGLMDYLQKETGFHVEWISSASYESFPADIERAKADVAFVSPLLYVVLAKTKGAFPIAKSVMPGGIDRTRGVIIAHDGTRRLTLKDLEGASVLIPSKMSLLGYVAQVALCQQQGIDTNRLKFVVVKRQDEVVVRVSRGVAKFGFVQEEALQEAAERADLSKVRILEKTRPYPTWCFIAFPETKQKMWERVKKALLKLDIDNPKHQKILQTAGLEGFKETKDVEYNLVRSVLVQLKLLY